jgi:hypothetical protein
MTVERTNKHVLDIIKPEISLESNILKQKLNMFDISGETMIHTMGNVRGKRKVRRHRMRWIEEVDSSRQMNLVEISRAKRDRNK